MFHEMLPFKYVLASELNSCCTCTVSTDIGCRFIHLCGCWENPFKATTITHVAKLGEITGKTRVLYSELGEITGKTRGG